MRDDNNNNIDDDFEERLFRELFITQVIGIIVLIILAFLVGHYVYG